MELSDSRDINAPPAVVWAALLDPEVLRACVPGCESMTGTADTRFEAAVVQKVGPVKARFTGVVTLSDRVEGQSLTISGEGKGGVAGYANGGAKVVLDPIPAGTRLSYEVNAHVGGKLAQLGSRIIDGFARKMADEFFARFQDAVEGPAETANDAETAKTAKTADDAETVTAHGAGTKPEKGWFRRITG